MAGYEFSREPQKVLPVSTVHRLIQTPIPAPGTADLLARLEICESRSMQGQLPLVWDRAQDFSVFDIAGNRWIDFTATYTFTNRQSYEIGRIVRKGWASPRFR